MIRTIRIFLPLFFSTLIILYLKGKVLTKKFINKLEKGILLSYYFSAMGLLVSLVEATSLEPKLKKLLKEFAEKIEFLESKQVTKDEFRELKALVEENSKAINRLTQRVDQLSQRMNQLTQRVDELAKAQVKTEGEIKKLAISLRETRKMVGGLSDAVGYTLEDRAIRHLPSLLKEKFNIKVKGELVRKFVEYNGRSDELNIYGEGERQGERIYIYIGRSKGKTIQKKRG